MTLALHYHHANIQMNIHRRQVFATTKEVIPYSILNIAKQKPLGKGL